jgi:hypothetical protein
MSIRILTAHRRLMRDQLVDEAVDCYIDWREQSRAAMVAYKRWISAPLTQRPLAFAAYGAALDQEEHAARRYASAIQTVELMLKPAR